MRNEEYDGKWGANEEMEPMGNKDISAEEFRLLYRGEEYEDETASGCED